MAVVMTDLRRYVPVFGTPMRPCDVKSADLRFQPPEMADGIGESRNGPESPKWTWLLSVHLEASQMAKVTGFRVTRRCRNACGLLAALSPVCRDVIGLCRPYLLSFFPSPS